MRLLHLFPAVPGLLMTVVGHASPVTYNYTGQNFNLASYPYSTASHVSGSLTLNAPLAANLNQYVYSPAGVAFSFRDGVQTINNADGSLTYLTFSTDNSGAINGYSITVYSGASFISVTDTSGSGGDTAFNQPTYGFATSLQVGSLTAVTPEPSSLILLITGTLSMFGMARLRVS